MTVRLPNVVDPTHVLPSVDPDKVVRAPSPPEPVPSDPRVAPVVTPPPLVALAPAAPAATINGRPVILWGLRSDGTVKAIGPTDVVP